MNDFQHVCLLPHSVDATNALCDSHRVPRQIIIDHNVAELEVNSLAPDLGGEEYSHSSIIAEALDLSFALRKSASFSAVDRIRGSVFLEQAGFVVEV